MTATLLLSGRRWLAQPRTVAAIILLIALLLAAFVGLNPDRAILVIGAIGGVVALALAIRYPLACVGLCCALVVTGGVSQTTDLVLLQRAYSGVFALAGVAYAHHLYSDRALLGRWLKVYPTDLLLFGLVMVAVASIGIAVDPRLARRAILVVVKAAAIYLLVSRAVQSRADLLVIGKFMLVAAIFQAGSVYSGSAISIGGGSHEILRVSGNLDDVNSFAATLLPGLCWAFYFARFGVGRWRWLALGGGGLIALGVLGTVSRTGTVILLLISLLWPLLAIRRIEAKLGYLLPVMVGMIFATGLYWDSLLARWPSLRDAIYPRSVTISVTDDGRRSELRDMAWKLADATPLLGVGIGNGSLIIGQAFRLGGEFHAHNMYAELALELGYSGLTAFLLMIGSALLAGLGAWWRATSDEQRGLVISPLLAFGTWLIFGNSVSAQFLNYAYCLLAILVAAAYAPESAERQP